MNKGNSKKNCMDKKIKFKNNIDIITQAIKSDAETKGKFKLFFEYNIRNMADVIKTRR